MFLDSLPLVVRLSGRSGGGEPLEERWRPLRSVNDKGDSWRYRLSITNRPSRCFLGKEVIQAPGQEIGRLWGISGGFLDLAAVIIEITGIEAGCGGLLYDWPASEG